MKNKIASFLTIAAVALSAQNVEACGEIKELTSSIGTVSTINETNYLVTVPEGTKELTLNGSTDYAWVQNYGPRTVSTTEGKVRLEVDGASCGEGITTYFVEFKFLSNLIAENDPTPVDPITPDPNAPDNQAPGGNTDPETNSTEPNYGVLPLTKLNIAEIDFEFDPSKRVYDLAVDGTVKALTIDAGTEDPVVTITISDNSNDLKEGINVIQITLADPYGNTGLYVLNVEKTKVKSTNNYLGSLIIDKYQLNFDPSITNYSLAIGKESTLNITPTTESELAQVAILGNSKLGNGSKITIRVTAENGSTRDYTINITRAFNIMDYWVYIIIVLLLLLLLIIFMLMKQKKNKKKMGPQTLEGQANTAGVVQEIAPQNQSAGSDQGAVNQNGLETHTTSSTPGTLKIIEPTNLDVQEQPSTAVNEDQSPTEVFQL